MKRFIVLCLTVCLICSGWGCAAQGQTEASLATDSSPVETVPAETANVTASGKSETAVPDKNIVILYTNDVHCGIEDGVGYAGLALLQNAYTAAGNDVMTVDCGDAVQGDAVGALSRGEYIVDIMNRMGYDIAIPGNHEFDYGIEQFLLNIDKAEFPYICCNWVDGDGNAVLEPYTVKEIGGIKIGFVGITTPQTLVSSTPTFFKDDNGNWIYGFCQDETGEALYAQVQSAVDAAKAAGADCVIALAHLGINEDCSPWTSSEVITHTTGIDVMLDGHSHSVIEGETVKNADGKPVILTSTGTKLANVGVLTLDTNGNFTTALIQNSDTVAFINGIKAQSEEQLNVVVAHSDVNLYITDPATGEYINRQSETNLGDLVADAYRAMAGADIGVINSGNLRTDLAAGDITYGNLVSVLPYGNSLSTVEATGAEILDALELSVSQLPGAFGGFLQVSGINFTVDMSVPSTVTCGSDSMFIAVEGERRVKDVTVGGEPIDPEKTYTVASTDYVLINMGNGYNMFTDNHFLQESAMTDTTVLTNYITQVLGGTVGAGYANPYGTERIRIINGDNLG